MNSKPSLAIHLPKLTVFRLLFISISFPELHFYSFPFSTPVLFSVSTLLSLPTSLLLLPVNPSFFPPFRASSGSFEEHGVLHTQQTQVRFLTYRILCITINCNYFVRVRTCFVSKRQMLPRSYYHYMQTYFRNTSTYSIPKLKLLYHF